MAKKLYEPEIIQENPFPTEPQLVPFAGQRNPKGTFTPKVSKDKAFPTRRTAIELLSTALNTRSKRILQEFQLQDSGGLKVGDFKQGASGDLRITPNGITARDIAGITTFAIDATTGDAIFIGTIRAGTIISGLVSVGDSSIVLDGENKRIVIFDNADDARIVIGNV